MQESIDIDSRFTRFESDLERGIPFEPLERTLRSILDSVPDIVYRVDATGRIVFINEAIRKYGYDPEQLIGTSLFDLIHPEDRDRARNRINERRTGDRSTRSLQLRLLAANKSVTLEVKETDTVARPLVVDAEGVYSDGGTRSRNFLYTQGVARDVSERSRLEREVEEAQREVAQRMSEHAESIRVAYDELQAQVEERVRREAEASAVQRVRDEIWRMQSPEDVKRVLRAINTSLHGLGIDFFGISINTVLAGPDPRVLHYAYTGDETGWLVSERDEVDAATRRFLEAETPVYRPDLDADDPFDERRTLEAGWKEPIRSVVNLPYEAGTLAVNSRQPEAFTDQDLRVLAELAAVLGEGFRRLQDLMTLQRHAAELEELASARQSALQRESALGRIRDRVLSMRHLGDLPAQSYWIEELRNLGVPIGGISIQLPGPRPDTFVTYYFQQGYSEPTPLDECPWIRQVWQSGQPVLVDRDHLDAAGFSDWAMTCILELPLPGGDGSLAVNRTGGTFDEEMVLTTVAFTGVVASGLRRLRDFERLAESEHRYRHLVEQLPIGVVHTETSGRVLYQNPYVRAMLGYSTQELNTMARGELYVEPREQVWLLRRIRASGEVTFDSALRRRDGGTVWVRGTARAVTDPDTGRREYHGYLEDVTDQKVMEDEYARLEEQLRQSQKMEAVGQLTAGIAHNFNNMLQGISGNLQLATIDADPRVSELLDDADRVTHRAATMIRQLLLFARQGLPPSIQPLRLAPVINSTIGICRRTFDRKIEITARLDEDLAVQGDAGLLQQLFLNLLINSRDALEGVEAPRITIEAVAVRAKDGSGPGGGGAVPTVQVRVTDNGIGMDEATQQRMYDPFYTTKPVDKGTGLGLATAYGIVTQHEGSIQCHSAPGAGTTFSIRLPAATASTPASAPAEAPESAPGGATLLVIDDERVVRDTTSRLLERCGYRVLLATDGRHGMELFAEHADDIDLVLLDLSMPQMSGKEVLAEIRRRGSRTKVLIFTGYATGEEEVDGADGIVQKPFTVAELTGQIRALLDS